MQKEGVSLLTGMWSFIWFDSLTQMEMLWKIIDRESSENFPKNVYNGVCFNKISHLCCGNWNRTITRNHHKLYSEYAPKNYFLGSNAEFFSRGFCETAIYKIWKSFCKMTLLFLIEQSCKPPIYSLKLYLKGSVWQKHIKLTFFNSRGNYYHPKDNIYVWMPMLRCQCQDFQVAVLSIFKDKDINGKSLSWKWTNSTKEINSFTYCNYSIAIWYYALFF